MKHSQFLFITAHSVHDVKKVIDFLVDGKGTLPDDIDGISVAPSILGKDQNTSKRFLYWEFYEFGRKQAVRWGK